MKLIKTVRDSLTKLFFPDVCPFCDEIVGDSINALVCDECFSRLEFVRSPLCTCCGKPFPVDWQADHCCGECLMERRYYSSARAVLFYENKVMDAVHRFKYSSALHLARPLGWLMYQRGREFFDFSNYDRIIPVPLHQKRLKSREFNQSQMLALELSIRSGTPVGLFSLERTKDTMSQVGLARGEREKNVRSAFRAGKIVNTARGAVLLEDDVISTSFTINEAARALIKAGAKRVDVLTLARGRGFI